MRQILSIIIVFTLLSSIISAQSKANQYNSYIKQYAPIAIKQQREHKIPASIILAQGLLESQAGQSDLSLQSNNHFGIKCGKNWTGDKVYHDDDTVGECFRKYKKVLDSYEDHSNFLTSRPRYSTLFSLESTDYKGWALGLKSAGYATDPNYAQKLIKLIEDYNLDQYDFVSNKSIRDKTATSHDLYKNNGVKCVFSQTGDTYQSIADEFKIPVTKLLAYNDLTQPMDLNPNSVIYLQKKKNKAAGIYTVHVVKEGENMYRIAQKYAIKLQKLYDINKKPYTQGATVGEQLKLRK